MGKSRANSRTSSRSRKPAAPPTTKPADPVTAYAKDVVEGRIPTGRLVRLACERHLRDLRTAKTHAWRFNVNEALAAIEFCESHLHHWEGRWQGRPLLLSPWEKFIVGACFGWQRRAEPDAEGYIGRRWVRRFNVAYIEIARRNGKTSLAAAVAWLLLVADGEEGAQVYSAATKLAQAKIAFDSAINMAALSPELAAMVVITKSGIYVSATNSKFEPLAKVIKTGDGLNVAGGIIDEFHAHPSSKLFDVLKSGTGSREQPLIFVITTAGLELSSPCRIEHDHSVRVLEDLDEGRHHFVFICCLDEGDEWTDSTVYYKANPGLGVNVKLEDLIAARDDALEVPSKQTEFRTKNLNQWLQARDRWLSLEVWREGNLPILTPESLKGRECWAGLDLGRTQSLSALVLWFPPTKEDLAAATEEAPAKHKLLAYFWLPGDGLDERCRRDKLPYSQWAREGLITLTPGPVTDYDFIQARVEALSTDFHIAEVCYDPWSAWQVAENLAKAGFKIIKEPQIPRILSDPTREFERLVLSRQIAHGGNKVLSAMIDASCVVHDSKGGMMLDKPKDAKNSARVDGVAAAIFALDRVIRRPVKVPARKPVTFFF